MLRLRWLFALAPAVPAAQGCEKRVEVDFSGGDPFGVGRAKP